MEQAIIIQRRPLAISPESRVNSYNHHSLTPWIAETGYLTPIYLHRREHAIKPFNMARWLTPTLAAHHMLRPPLLPALELTIDHIEVMLRAAAAASYDQARAAADKTLQGLASELERLFPQLRDELVNEAGYFVRMSQCSPKDTDGGILKPINNILGALIKLVTSKRTVQALIALHLETQDSGSSADSLVDSKVYFFQYATQLDRMSEWRCYVNAGRVVAISQTRFFQPNYEDITDEALGRLAHQSRALWDSISEELPFDSCCLDVYAEVRRPGFDVRLIEINPWGAHLGSGSLLFHWLDDAGILTPADIGSAPTVVRVVQAARGEPVKALTRDDAYKIGRERSTADELQCLRERGLEWILKEEAHRKFMALEAPGRQGMTTRKGALEVISRQMAGEKAEKVARKDHPRFVKLRKAYLESLGAT